MQHVTKRQKIALGAFFVIIIGIGCQIIFEIVSDGTANLLGIAGIMIYGTILFHIRR